MNFFFVPFVSFVVKKILLPCFTDALRHVYDQAEKSVMRIVKIRISGYSKIIAEAPLFLVCFQDRHVSH